MSANLNIPHGIGTFKRYIGNAACLPINFGLSSFHPIILDCHLKECYKGDLELLDLRKELRFRSRWPSCASLHDLYGRKQNVTAKSPPP